MKGSLSKISQSPPNLHTNMLHPTRQPLRSRGCVPATVNHLCRCEVQLGSRGNIFSPGSPAKSTWDFEQITSLSGPQFPYLLNRQVLPFLLKSAGFERLKKENRCGIPGWTKSAMQAQHRASSESERKQDIAQGSHTTPSMHRGRGNAVWGWIE